MSQKDNDVEASIPLTVSYSSLDQDPNLIFSPCPEHPTSIETWPTENELRSSTSPIPCRDSGLTVVGSLVHRPTNLRKSSFPLSSVCLFVPGRAWLTISHPNLDGMLHLRHPLQQYADTAWRRHELTSRIRLLLIGLPLPRLPHYLALDLFRMSPLRSTNQTD
jgi:hypothetical protein